MDHELFDTREAAAYIHMSEGFLKQVRSTGNLPGRTPGPRYLKLGRKIRYRKSDLDSWLEAREVEAEPYEEVVAHANR